MNERDAPQNREGREDGFLRTFVQMAERGLSLPITLSVGGMLISGILVSYSEYLNLIGDQMRGLPIQELRESLSEMFAKLAESAQDVERERTREAELLRLLEEEPEDEFIPAYIHLKDTKFFLTDVDMPILGGALWRGKIAAIDGFFLGSFHRSPITELVSG